MMQSPSQNVYSPQRTSRTLKKHKGNYLSLRKINTCHADIFLGILGDLGGK